MTSRGPIIISLTPLVFLSLKQYILTDKTESSFFATLQRKESGLIQTDWSITTKFVWNKKRDWLKTEFNFWLSEKEISGVIDRRLFQEKFFMPSLLKIFSVLVE